MGQTFNDLNQLKLNLDFQGFKAELLYWGFFVANEWWRNYLHVHSFFEICYAYKGKGEFHINRQTHLVKEGDLFIVKPNERHEIISSNETPLGIYFWSFTLFKDAKSQPNSDVSKLLEAFVSSSTVLLAEQETSAKLLELLEHEITQKNLGYPVIIEGLSKHLILETARACTSSKNIPAKNIQDHGLENKDIHFPKNTVVDTILRYLKDNYQQNLSLKEISAQVHLSERHVSRLFKTFTGQSVKHYLNYLRLDVAKQLLVSKSTTISEIAYQTGFQDARHFSTLFRKHTGSSPSQYREQGGTRFL